MEKTLPVASQERAVGGVEGRTKSMGPLKSVGVSAETQVVSSSSSFSFAASALLAASAAGS